jgi:hypothetical protein
MAEDVLMATLASAGNVLVPAYLVLIEKGYRVERLSTAKRKEPELWCATKGESRFVAEDTLSLLGLVSIHEVRGKVWKASDNEIDSFFEQFP